MPMNEIIPGLWLGDWEAAYETDILRSHGITHILSVLRVGPLKIPPPFITLQIDALDSPKYDLLSHFPACNQFIGRALGKKQGILVHCQAGISRSATVVAAYLISTQFIEVKAALELIKKSRPVIQPNHGFYEQLIIYHKASCTISPQDKPTRLHYIQKAVKGRKAGHAITVESAMLASPTSGSGASKGRRIRCRMCRYELATKEHLLEHGEASTAFEPPEEEDIAEDTTAADGTTGDGDGVPPAASPVSPPPMSRAVPLPHSAPSLLQPKCSGYFIEPMDWMQRFLDEGNTEGKINCPNKKCNAKLGNYDWAGVKCSCGVWVTPGFCIHKTRVDELG